MARTHNPQEDYDHMARAHNPQGDYDHALAECAEAERWWHALQESISRGALVRSLIESLQAMVPRGLYRHFKGGLYVIESILPDVNGRADPGVDYTALYGELAGLAGWRVLYGQDGFLTPVDRAEHVGCRFVLIKRLSIRDSAALRANALHIARAATSEKQLERALRTIDPRLAR